MKLFRFAIVSIVTLVVASIVPASAQYRIGVGKPGCPRPSDLDPSISAAELAEILRNCGGVEESTSSEAIRQAEILRGLYQFHEDLSGPPGELRKYYDDTVLANGLSKSIEQVMASRYSFAREYPDRKVTIDKDTVDIDPLDDAGLRYRLRYQNVSVVGNGDVTKTIRWHVESYVRRDGTNYRFYEVNVRAGE